MTVSSILQPIAQGSVFATLGEGGSDLYRLFANGEDGFLFGNFGDLTRLFTTSTGGVAVAADADPVGLALEDRAWQKRTYAQQVAQAAELITNGSFASDVSGWTAGLNATISWSAGALVLTNTAGGFGRATQGIATVVGKTYRISATIVSAVASSMIIAKADNSAGTVNFVTLRTVTGAGTYEAHFVATQTTTYITIDNNTAGTGDTSNWDDISCKLVDGNHGLQATGVQRPVYKPNSGKPYLSFDGSDDTLVTPFRPTAAMTLAAACRINTNPNTFVLGGGFNTSNLRVGLGVSGSGQIGGQWGAQNQGIIQAGSDIRGTDRVLLLTGDATSVELWLDGAQVYSQPSSGTPGGTTGVALGCLNNNGSLVAFMLGNVYSALALSRRVTASEIALITSKFRSTYQ